MIDNKLVNVRKRNSVKVADIIKTFSCDERECKIETKLCTNDVTTVATLNFNVYFIFSFKMFNVSNFSL